MTAGELAEVIIAAATLVSSVAALVVAVRTSGRVEATHALVNGQSGALTALTGKAAYAEGVLAGSAVAGESLVDSPSDRHSDSNLPG